MDSDVEEALSALKLDDSRGSSNDILHIGVDGKTIICNRILLVSECEYFRAFDNFELNKDVVIKGGLSYQTLKAIVNFLNGQHLELNLGNFQDILSGCLFLQCKTAEAVTVNFITCRLNRENAFNTLLYSKDIGSSTLVKNCVTFLEREFSTILNCALTKNKVEDFLEMEFEKIRELFQSDVQCEEELLFWAAVGWIIFQPERIVEADILIETINFALFSQSGLSALAEEEEVMEKYNLAVRVQEAAVCHGLRLDRQIEFWRCRGAARRRRWPKLVVAASTGSLQGGLQCLDLTRPAPAWKPLTKKPTELRKRSTGSTMVYSHPRLFFLGGEQHWRLDWYDLVRFNFLLVALSATQYISLFVRPFVRHTFSTYKLTN